MFKLDNDREADKAVDRWHASNDHMQKHLQVKITPACAICDTGKCSFRLSPGMIGIEKHHVRHLLIHLPLRPAEIGSLAPVRQPEQRSNLRSASAARGRNGPPSHCGEHLPRRPGKWMGGFCLQTENRRDRNA